MGSSAQMAQVPEGSGGPQASGVCWCRFRRQVPEGSGESWCRFRKQVPEGFGQFLSLFNIESYEDIDDPSSYTSRPHNSSPF